MVARASDTELATCVVAGLLGSALVLLLAPSWWRALPALVLLSAVGAWGIAERERERGGRGGAVFTLVRGTAVLASLVAAATLFLIFMRATLGRWIS